MNTLLLPISEYVQKCAVDIRTTSIAVGLAVSRHLTLPSSEVESINMHFVSQVEATMNQYLSIINEDMVLDFDLATKTARNAYIIRYMAAYPKADGSAILPSCGTFFERAFNVGTYFDDTTRAHCESNADAIISLTNRILAILPALIKS